MTKQTKLALSKLEFYGSIPRKYRYSAAIKDKCWSLLSDFVRVRDFIKYSYCVSCGKKITDWRASQAGHFVTMGGHGALIGFSELNVHAQCAICNFQSSQHTGAIYRDTLVKRYGEGILLIIEGLKNDSVKADDFFFIKKLLIFWDMFTALKKENPDFHFPSYLK